jgi:hypothetical protein
MATTNLQCSCGEVQLELSARPIASVECCCASCRTVSRHFERLPSGRAVLTDFGATPYVMYRKDHVRVVSGTGKLKAYKLSEKTPTQRILATCCNTPMFLDFQPGHWLSMYGNIWPAGARPPVQFRVMTRYLEAGVVAPGDVPHFKQHGVGLVGKLLSALVAMRFRRRHFEVPELEVIG